MNLIIEQKKIGYNYKYLIKQNNELLYQGRANRIILFRYRKIQLLSKENQILYKLKQESIISKILENVPIINFFKIGVCPYNIYANDGLVGNLREHERKFEAYGTIDNNKYEIFGHTNNYYSIYRNEEQIGEIKKDNYSNYDGDRYNTIFNKDIKKEIISIICLFIDIIWNTNDTEIHTHNYSYNIQLGGKKRNENWKPND